jgi:hypothetical protein
VKFLSFLHVEWKMQMPRLEPGNYGCIVFSVHIIASNDEGLKKNLLSGGHSVETAHGEGTFVRLATPNISVVYEYFGQGMSLSLGLVYC